MEIQKIISKKALITDLGKGHSFSVIKKTQLKLPSECKNSPKLLKVGLQGVQKGINSEATEEKNG